MQARRTFAVKSEVLGMSSARSTYRIFGKNLDQLLYLQHITHKLKHTLSTCYLHFYMDSGYTRHNKTHVLSIFWVQTLSISDEIDLPNKFMAESNSVTTVHIVNSFSFLQPGVWVGCMELCINWILNTKLESAFRHDYIYDTENELTFFLYCSCSSFK